MNTDQSLNGIIQSDPHGGEKPSQQTVLRQPHVLRGLSFLIFIGVNRRLSAAQKKAEGIAAPGFLPRAGARLETAVKNQTNLAADGRRYNIVTILWVDLEFIHVRLRLHER